MNAGDREHRERDQQDHDPGAEVGLVDDESRRHQHHGKGDHQGAKALDLLGMDIVEVARERDHQQHLHQLRGLDAILDGPQPPPRAVDLDADQRHEHQQAHRERVGASR